MIDLILAALAMAVVAAYACRVDRLTWRTDPMQMLLHAAGGIGTAWVLKEAAQGNAGALDGLLLAGCALLLVLTYQHLPAVVPAPSTRSLRNDELGQVAGGKDAP